MAAPVPRSDGPPPPGGGGGAAPTGAPPPGPPGGMTGQPMMADPMYAQRFATNLIDALMRRVQMARQQRATRGY